MKQDPSHKIPDRPGVGDSPKNIMVQTLNRPCPPRQKTSATSSSVGQLLALFVPQQERPSDHPWRPAGGIPNHYPPAIRPSPCQILVLVASANNHYLSQPHHQMGARRRRHPRTCRPPHSPHLRLDRKYLAMHTALSTVIASVAKQSPCQCARTGGLPRRDAPRNDRKVSPIKSNIRKVDAAQNNLRQLNYPAPRNPSRARSAAARVTHPSA